MNAQRMFLDVLADVPDNIRRQTGYTMSISDRIAAILAAKGMSQKDFAKLMGRSQAEVSRWLGGTHNFTISTLANISTALGEDIISVVD